MCSAAASTMAGCHVRSCELSEPLEQHVFVMRHGERLDSIDRQWLKRAVRPYDTPLSKHGEHEARRLVKQRMGDKVKCKYRVY